MKNKKKRRSSCFSDELWMGFQAKPVGNNKYWVRKKKISLDAKSSACLWSLYEKGLMLYEAFMKRLFPSSARNHSSLLLIPQTCHTSYTLPLIHLNWKFRHLEAIFPRFYSSMLSHSDISPTEEFMAFQTTLYPEERPIGTNLSMSGDIFLFVLNCT